GKFDRLPRTTARFTSARLDGYGLCCSLPTRPRAQASYPVLVHRHTLLLHASFRPRLATTPLRFANPSPPSGWIRDSHPQTVEHARHTMTGGANPCGFRTPLGNRCAIPTFPPPRRLLDCFLNSNPERSFPPPPAQAFFRLILRLEKTGFKSLFSSRVSIKDSLDTRDRLQSLPPSSPRSPVHCEVRFRIAKPGAGVVLGYLWFVTRPPQAVPRRKSSQGAIRRPAESGTLRSTAPRRTTTFCWRSSKPASPCAEPK